MSAESDVLAAEQRRCLAIANADLAELRDLLAEDYLHVYGNGATSGRDAYIEAIIKRPRMPERANLAVRLYGDAAVLTGDLINRIEESDGTVRVVDTVATQVLHRQDGKWRFVSCQLTPRNAARG